MKGKPMNLNLTNHLIVPLALGLACAGIVFASLSGKPLPLIGGPRAALIAVLVIGMAACTGGIGQVAASGRWLSAPAILGYLLGLAILVVVVAGLAGWRLPFVQTEAQALAAAAALMAVKFLIGIPAYFFHWL